MLQITGISFDSKYLKPLDTILRCSICNEHYNYCVMTACCHNFCAICIRKRMKTMEFGPDCPICFEVLEESDLRNNKVVNDLVRIYKQMNLNNSENGVSAQETQIETTRQDMFELDDIFENSEVRSHNESIIDCHMNVNKINCSHSERAMDIEKSSSSSDSSDFMACSKETTKMLRTLVSENHSPSDEDSRNKDHNFHKYFEIPWDKMPLDLLKSFEEKEKLSEKQRLKMLQIICEEIFRYDKKLEKYILMRIAKKAFEKYPASLCDDPNTASTHYTCVSFTKHLIYQMQKMSKKTCESSPKPITTSQNNLIKVVSTKSITTNSFNIQDSTSGFEKNTLQTYSKSLPNKSAPKNSVNLVNKISPVKSSKEILIGKAYSLSPNRFSPSRRSNKKAKPSHTLTKKHVDLAMQVNNKDSIVIDKTKVPTHMAEVRMNSNTSPSNKSSPSNHKFWKDLNKENCNKSDLEFSLLVPTCDESLSISDEELQLVDFNPVTSDNSNQNSESLAKSIRIIVPNLIKDKELNSVSRSCKKFDKVWDNQLHNFNNREQDKSKTFSESAKSSPLSMKDILWYKTFTIPWHKIPPSIFNDLKQGVRLDPQKRKTVVSIICDKILKFDPYPNKHAINVIAQKAIEKFRDSLNVVSHSSLALEISKMLIKKSIAATNL